MQTVDWSPFMCLNTQHVYNIQPEETPSVATAAIADTIETDAWYHSLLSEFSAMDVSSPSTDSSTNFIAPANVQDCNYYYSVDLEINDTRLRAYAVAKQPLPFDQENPTHKQALTSSDPETVEKWKQSIRTEVNCRC